jgi:DNA-binding transcriptional ArsR family regulator
VSVTDISAPAEGWRGDFEAREAYVFRMNVIIAKPVPPKTLSAKALPSGVSMAEIGALVGDPARANMLTALMNGESLTASDLAWHAGVTPQTASGHLARMTEAELIKVTAQGRHRYYKLASPLVAQMLESIFLVAADQTMPRRRIPSYVDTVMRDARTCYDHLAGRLGTELMAALLRRDLLEGGTGRFDPARAKRDRLSAPGRDLDYRLTERGAEELRAFGVDVDELPRRRRLIRYCVDWTEQRHHLSGALGAALARRMLELGWVRRARAGRAVLVTEGGYAGLRDRFGVELG